MPLPAELLRAVSSPGGWKIALVVGAGCSVLTPPTVANSFPPPSEKGTYARIGAHQNR